MQTPPQLGSLSGSDRLSWQQASPGVEEEEQKAKTFKMFGFQIIKRELWGNTGRLFSGFLSKDAFDVSASHQPSENKILEADQMKDSLWKKELRRIKQKNVSVSVITERRVRGGRTHDIALCPF